MSSSLKWAATLATILACQAPVLRAQPQSDLGRLEYEGHCAACHGLDGRGAGPYSVNLKLPVPDLTLLAARSSGIFPVERVRRVIDGREDIKGHGGRQMPIWGVRYGQQAREYFRGEVADPEAFAEQRVRALAEYLRSLQR